MVCTKLQMTRSLSISHFTGISQKWNLIFIDDHSFWGPIDRFCQIQAIHNTARSHSRAKSGGPFYNLLALGHRPTLNITHWFSLLFILCFLGTLIHFELYMESGNLCQMSPLKFKKFNVKQHKWSVNLIKTWQICWMDWRNFWSKGISDVVEFMLSWLYQFSDFIDRAINNVILILTQQTIKNWVEEADLKCWVKT